MTHVDDCASFDICPSRVALVASAESRRIAAGLSSLEIVVVTHVTGHMFLSHATYMFLQTERGSTR